MGYDAWFGIVGEGAEIAKSGIADRAASSAESVRFFILFILVENAQVAIRIEEVERDEPTDRDAHCSGPVEARHDAFEIVAVFNPLPVRSSMDIDGPCRPLLVEWYDQ